MQSASAVVTPAPEIHPRTRRALEFMRAHFNEHLTEGQVAGRAGLSASRLRHLLTAETGAPFSAHLKELRLLEAEALLDDCSLRISEIAYRCGYTSVPSFSREFKRRFGKCPSSHLRARFRRPSKTASRIAA